MSDGYICDGKGNIKGIPTHRSIDYCPHNALKMSRLVSKIRIVFLFFLCPNPEFQLRESGKITENRLKVFCFYENLKKY
jgi:hypothetical protein